MATVWRAHDQVLDCERAIKILAPAMAAKAKVRTRFDNEARTMAKLVHTAIVTVHDVGADADRPYIVMELLEGGSAMGWVERHGPMPPRMGVQLMITVLEALHAAHGRGVVHRDIKPHNVLLTRDGAPKVTDFGIAQVRNETDQHLTRTGMVMGTWAYMAPEQKQSAKAVDARGDVYSSAASLYALLTAQEPFDLFATEAHDDIATQLPLSLAEIIRKGTRFRPDDRYPNAMAMATALRNIVHELPEIPDESPPLGEVVLPALGSEGAPSTLHTFDSAAISANLPDEEGATAPGAPSRVHAPSAVTGSSQPAPIQRVRAPAMSLKTLSASDVKARSQNITAMSDIAPVAEAVVVPVAPPAPAARSPLIWVALAAVVLLVLAIGGVLLAGGLGGAAVVASSTTPPPEVPVLAPIDVAPVVTPAEVAPAVAPVVATEVPSKTVETPVKTVETPVKTGEAPPAQTKTVPTPEKTPEKVPVVVPEAPAVVPVVAPETATVAPASVKIVLNSMPYSFVSIDGTKIGRTAQSLEYAPGTHSVTFDTADGRTKTLTLDFPAGGIRYCYDFAKDGPC